MHRLEGVSTHLSVAENAILIDDINKATLLGIKADLDFFQGNYKKALEGYQEALALHTDSTNLFRLAIYYWRTGNLEQAEEYINQTQEISKVTSPRLTAFLHLHKGLFDLDKERFDEALIHYKEANAIFDGWWLVKEHIAEIYVLQGKIKAAKEIYTDVIAETGNPEFMDAIAAIANSKEEAAEWIAKARTGYEAQLAQFPEANYSHTLEHYLDVGDVPEKALELAQLNYELRPYGEAEVLLARAYLQAGYVDKAKEVIENTLESRWRNADLNVVVSLVF